MSTSPPRAGTDTGEQPTIYDLRRHVDRFISDVSADIRSLEERLREITRVRARLRGRREDVDVLRKSFQNSSRIHPATEVDRVITSIVALRVEVATLDERERCLQEALSAAQRTQENLWDLQGRLGKVRAVANEDVAFPGGADARQVFQLVEDERMRIARDMHDGPAQSMANLVLQAEIIENMIRADPNSITECMEAFKRVVFKSLEETRRLIFDLRPMDLDDLGLISTLRGYVADYSASPGPTAHLHLLGEERRLPIDLEEAIFRIVQEALSNARKHANATVVDVTLTATATRVSVSVRDNGRGFDVVKADNQETRRHLGLTSMRERGQLHNGVVDIRSTPGSGTEVSVTFAFEESPATVSA